jgi:hypothetical protein
LDPTIADANLGKVSPDVTFTIDPVVAKNKNGRLEVFEVDENGQVWHNWMRGPNVPNSGWSGWQALGDTASVISFRALVVGTNADGRLEVFGRSPDADHHVVHIWQTSPGGGWASGGFVTIGANPASVAFETDPVVGINQDGRLEVFIVDDKTGSGTNAVWHKYQAAPNSGWVDWLSLDGAMLTSGSIGCGNSGIAVGSNADGRLEVFGRDNTDPNHAIVHRYQTAPNSGWSAGFVVLATQPAGQFSDGDPVVGRNLDGRLEVFIIASNTDNCGCAADVWHVWQNAPNSGWSSYLDMGGGVFGALDVISNQDGRLEIFDQGDDFHGSSMFHNWQTPSPGSGWYGFSSLGGEPADYN